MIMDEYSFKARLQPMVLVLLPLLFLAVIHISQLEMYFHYISSVVVFGCVSFLLAQIGRDFGKQKEKSLFLNWGGKPSIQLLRHSDLHIDKITKSRYHKSLEILLGDIMLPTPLEESEDQERADKIYEACIKHLIISTRDTVKYNLLFKENINYGFRRNLYGLKTIALLIIALSIITHLGINFYPATYQIVLNRTDWIVTSILLTTGFCWIVIVNSDWVRLPANAYAERLLETTKSL